MDYLGDQPTEEQMQEQAKKQEEMFLKALKNEPQIKLVLGGCVMEMIEKGIIEVEIWISRRKSPVLCWLFINADTQIY